MPPCHGGDRRFESGRARHTKCLIESWGFLYGQVYEGNAASMSLFYIRTQFLGIDKSRNICYSISVMTNIETQIQHEAVGLGNVSPDHLATLLAATGNAHHEYEATLGEPDADWLGWYTQHLNGLLEQESSQADPTTLGALLGAAADAYPTYEQEAKDKGETPAGWPAWYAQYMIDGSKHPE